MRHLNRLPASSAHVRLYVPPSRAYAMGMPARQSEWTAEMARALPDDGMRYEVLASSELRLPRGHPRAKSRPHLRQPVHDD